MCKIICEYQVHILFLKKLINVHISILTYIQQDASYTVYFILKLLYMFRLVPSPIIRSADNCIYSIWCCVLCTAHSDQFQLFHNSGR
jgi:hypothetical protein